MAQINDPSKGVPQPLLLHVHLLSTIQFPHQSNTLGQGQILHHLLQAPRIVRESSPVAWQIVRVPKDGTVLLRWQPISQLGTNYATDGYVWPGPETTIERDIHGYKLEILLQQNGYQPGESVASHRRVRYRLTGVPNSEPFDTNLELVHYLQGSPETRVAVSSLPPLNAREQALWQQWQFLEHQGALTEKRFMLNDSNNWPTISMPSGRLPAQGQAMSANPYRQQQQATAAAMAGRGRGGVQVQPGRPPLGTGPGRPGLHNQAGQGRGAGGANGFPPAKRGRPAHGSRAQQQARQSVVQTAEDIILADEMDPSADSLDYLSPREISVTRFKQHTEWMEEIMVSSMEMHHILPSEIGFGRPGGELAQLTEGLFEDPLAMEKRVAAEAAAGKLGSNEVPADIDPEKVDEFEKRVREYEENGRKEIEDMKAQHATRLQELAARKSLAQLEKRLALAASDDDPGVVDEIVREAEKMTGRKLTAKEEVSRVQAGGLLQGGEAETQPESNGNLPGQPGDEFNEFTNMDFFHTEPYESNVEFPT